MSRLSLAGIAYHFEICYPDVAGLRGLLLLMLFSLSLLLLI